MAAKCQYRTKHREELLSFLETVPGRHITVSDVCGFFQKSGRVIGTATVYRQLERMVNEGIVKKYIIDANSPACFEYVGDHPEKCCEPVCFHCKCERCGSLIHLHCEELEGLGEHLLEHHGFRLNPMRTVFYGICANCRSEETQHTDAGEENDAARS